MKKMHASYAVTTSQQASSALIQKAEAFSQEHRIPYVPRAGSLEQLAQRLNLVHVFVFTAKEILLWHQGHEIRFHTNMAKHRIMGLKNGRRDRMQKAMDLTAGDSILDCTLGLGTDAIVASFIVGPTGRVTGLESEQSLYLLVKYGLQEYALPSQEYLIEPMRRIRVCHIEALDFLRRLPDQSYDVVYFDPMFRKTHTPSTGICGIRLISNPKELTPEHIHEAQRVAKKSVVLKERTGSHEFGRLGFVERDHSRGATVCFGVIRQ